jgi:hypothetical protein
MVPLGPLLTAGVWPTTHDGIRYWFLFEGFRDAFLHGFIYPRWMPDFYGGYGSPTFLYYQPGFFYIFLAVSFLIDAPWVQMCLALGLVFLGGSVGAYLMARRLADRFTALLAAAVFVLTPYHFVNLYVRGALAELTAAMIVPWSIFFLIALRDAVRDRRGGEWRWATGLAVAVASVAYAHPATSLLLMPVLGMLAIVIAWPLGLQAGWRCLLHAGLGVVAGLALSAPYWFTAMARLSDVDMLLAAPYLRPFDHMVNPDQFFARTWGFGFSHPGPNDSMSFQLGLPHFILALSGMILGWREPFVRGAFGIYLLLLVFMTPLAADVWRFALLDNVQFSWRTLSVTAGLQVLALTGLSSLSRDAPKARPLIVLSLLAFFVGWHGNMFQVNPPFHQVTRAWIDREYALGREQFDAFIQHNPFTPRTALAARPEAPRENFLTLEGAGAVVELPDSDSYRLNDDLDLPQTTNVVINQVYFPGWVVRIDDAEVAASDLVAGLTEDGRPRITVPQGRHRLEAYYGGPPGWQIRDLSIIAVLIAVGAALWGLRRSSESLGKKRASNR